MARTHRPWGRETPGTRLRSTAARAREGLGEVDAPGFGDIDARVRRVVTESRALLEALEYIARTGFRGRASETSIPAEEVNTALGSMRDALLELAHASVLTLSERYAAFSGALDAVLALADAAQVRGIAGSAVASRDDPWSVFER